jgi:hypothetical protein
LPNPLPESGIGGDSEAERVDRLEDLVRVSRGVVEQIAGWTVAECLAIVAISQRRQERGRAILAAQLEQALGQQRVAVAGYTKECSPAVEGECREPGLGRAHRRRHPRQGIQPRQLSRERGSSRLDIAVEQDLGELPDLTVERIHGQASRARDRDAVDRYACRVQARAASWFDGAQERAEALRRVERVARQQEAQRAVQQRKHLLGWEEAGYASEVQGAPAVP